MKELDIGEEIIEEGEERCVCGHQRYSHDGSKGECGYFINELLGDCECDKFQQI